MENSVISTWITSPYVSQPSSVVFACQTAHFGPEKQISMGPRFQLPFCSCNAAWVASELLVSMGPNPHVWFLDAIERLFGPKKQVSISPRHNLSFCACNTAWLAPELLVSMGPNPYLWFLYSKQRLLEPNNKSLKVPDITCRCVHVIQRD